VIVMRGPSIVLAVTLLAISSRLAHADEVAWQGAAAGIEYVEFATEGPGLRQPVRAVRLDLTKVRMRLVAAGEPGVRQTVSRIAAPFAEHVAINASFFDDKDRAIGAVVDSGTLVARRVVKSWGALVIAGKSSHILLGDALRLEPPPLLTVQGIPRLLVAGELTKLKPQIADRTAVCAQGRFLILVVTGSLEATALAELLRDRLGCRDALNLDGGPSTQLSIRLGKLHVDVPGWGVPNALIALPGAK
jgi:hypothetical protein